MAMVQLLVVIIGAIATISDGILVPAIAKTRVEAQGWLRRAQRAHRNMLESVALFETLVLVGARHRQGERDDPHRHRDLLLGAARLHGDLHRRRHLGSEAWSSASRWSGS